MSLGQSSSNFPSFSLPSKSIEVEFALKLWRESADAQNSTAMFNLGLYFERNRGTPSEVLLQTFPNVQALIAASMSSSSSTTNLVSDIMTEQAYEFYQHASDHGIDAAWMGCHRLHLDIERIQGDRQESSIAPELMMRAKIQSRTESPEETTGSEEAAYEVALTFFEGREPVTQNYFKAHQWLLRSVASLVQSIATSSPLSFSSPFLPPNYLNQLLDSSNGSKFMPHHGKACFQLGVMYDHGLGCKINSSEAMRWLLLAAFFCIPPAMSNLGLFLMFIDFSDFQYIDSTAMDILPFLRFHASHGQRI
jgi:TPR repeat protein